ncbi:MAG TPA: flagellar basal body rod C-terminal domain-containing protein [Aliidongia sp.]|uniref:FlgK family flagellar hook-associated protein n=1 Tax=Aliidongia sp. TaxID=1914230 RepID=UPI002DDD1DAA|nr:flagellar basal body rod C-terminal domain-containing protein [Aliidongia sp.]HEV2678819.1 flagellar basal body rod C-terminal domain-containing protein [Aliidongia sp.]
MSLMSILSNATSALLNTQSQINVVSQNIGNAQNPNYSQRSTVVIDKSPQNGGGTQIVDVQRAVDGTLQTNYLNQITNAGSTTTVSQLYTQLEQLTGSSTTSPILSSALQAFQNAWQALQATPEDRTTQQQVVNSAQALVSTIQTVAHGVEKIAGQVTTQLGSDVTTLNTSLSQIATLNAQIVSGRNNGQDTSALEDSRDQLITTVAGMVPVQQQMNGDGSIYLSTPSGVALVQQSPDAFAYDATTDTLYNKGDPAKSSLNGALTSGQIGAEIGILANSGSQAVSDVSSLNGQLTQLAAVNTAIAGGSTPALVAQQTSLIAGITALVPTTVTTNANGTKYLSTPSGTLLVGATTNQFGYDTTTNTFYNTSAPGTSLNAALTSGTLATDIARAAPVANATAPGVGALDQIRNQLNGLADLFYASPPAAPTAFQTAYDSATPVNTGELAASFFTMSATSGSAADRFNLEVNPALVNGTATVKQSAAITVAVQMAATTTSLSAGGISTGPTSYLGVANAIASDQSGRASAATSAQTAATANTSAAQQAYRNVTGVSSDQQLAQLVSLQNAYSAAAKIISTVQELESTLLTAVGGA